MPNNCVPSPLILPDSVKDMEATPGGTMSAARDSMLTRPTVDTMGAASATASPRYFLSTALSPKPKSDYV